MRVLFDEIGEFNVLAGEVLFNRCLLRHQLSSLFKEVITYVSII